MEPQPVKKPINPWMIIGWIIVGSLVLCGGGCGAVFLLGSASTTTTTSPAAAPSQSSGQTTLPAVTSPPAPTAQPVGTPQTNKAGDTVTVHSFQDPYISGNQFMQPAAGARLVTADVEVCAGPKAGSSILFDWSARTDTNRKYQPTISDASPTFDGPANPGECTRGYVTFEVTDPDSVTGFVYDDELNWWTITAP